MRPFAPGARLIPMVVPQDGVGSATRGDLLAISSHDTPPFLGWWRGVDIADLVDLGEFDDDRARKERDEREAAKAALSERFGSDDPAVILDGLLAWMSETEAGVTLATLDDVLGEARRQNVPGTHRERPNWRLRYATTVEDMAFDPTFRVRLEAMVRPSS